MSQQKFTVEDWFLMAGLILIVLASVGAIILASRPRRDHAQVDLPIQAVAEGRGVSVSWDTGNGPRVFDATMCTTVPSEADSLFQLNCFWHHTSYEPPFRTQDSSLLCREQCRLLITRFRSC